MDAYFYKYLLEITQAKSAKKVNIIQSLWSGYGSVLRYEVEGGIVSSVVVKHISPKANKQKHPRGWNTSNSHLRKLKSYEVETAWYGQWNEKCRSAAITPKCLGTLENDEERWIILEDLDEAFPQRISTPSLNDVKLGLTWLANFHAQFIQEEPKGLWEIGTYWHLGTRQDEWGQMSKSRLKEKAQYVDGILNHCKFKTILHGDAKLANFCFSDDGKEVAAVDFQYAGGGCGMKDVAYFLGSCLDSQMLFMHDTDLLNHYFITLKKALMLTPWANDFLKLEKEWRGLYAFACIDFTRFLMGWMPTHHKINEYQLALVKGLEFDE